MPNFMEKWQMKKNITMQTSVAMIVPIKINKQLQSQAIRKESH